MLKLIYVLVMLKITDKITDVFPKQIFDRSFTSKYIYPLYANHMHDLAKNTGA